MEPRTGEDYVCSMCKHSGFEPVPTRAATEEQETHMDVDTDTQPAQSDMDCEPARTDGTGPGQTAAEPRCEAADVTEHKGSGKIGIRSPDLASSTAPSRGREGFTFGVARFLKLK